MATLVSATTPRVEEARQALTNETARIANSMLSLTTSGLACSSLGFAVGAILATTGYIFKDCASFGVALVDSLPVIGFVAKHFPGRGLFVRETALLCKKLGLDSLHPVTFVSASVACHVLAYAGEYGLDYVNSKSTADSDDDLPSLHSPERGEDVGAASLSPEEAREVAERRRTIERRIDEIATTIRNAQFHQQGPLEESLNALIGFERVKGNVSDRFFRTPERLTAVFNAYIDEFSRLPQAAWNLVVAESDYTQPNSTAAAFVRGWHETSDLRARFLEVFTSGEGSYMERFQAAGNALIPTAQNLMTVATAHFGIRSEAEDAAPSEAGASPGMRLGAAAEPRYPEELSEK